MQNRRLLLADNDPVVLRTLRDALRRRGYRVTTAQDPEQTMKILRAGKVDLAIVDMSLVNDKDDGDRTGLAVVERSGAGIPKILLTGRDLLAEEMDRIQRNGVRLVLKASGIIVLDQEIKRALVPQVFIAHGHNETALLRVALRLQQWGLNHTILFKQPDAGTYILSDLEKYANRSAAAVIVMTADDVAWAKSRPETQMTRARQNVVFELGYFIAKLGSSNVIALIEDGIERPSNYDGVKYITFDRHGAWEAALREALTRAGIDISLYE
jgi:ActR/RegA family two-component response regulator